MNKNTWIIGFTLFAMFFGAGNLIFPTQLGLESGHFFWPAILAFALTGIGLPLLGVVVGALDKHGYIGSFNKISPRFSLIFLIIIYLTNLALFIFTVIYFLIVLYLCLNPNKMIDRIGSLLTPLLLITIVAMIIKGFVDFSGHSSNYGMTNAYHSNLSGFSQGFTQGYLTMDAIASIAFSMIVVNAIKTTGIQHADKIFKQTIIAGLIAAIALVFIYISLGYIGNHINIPSDTLKELKAKDQNIGTYLLTTMATKGFGTFGKYLLGIIVSLACLTTACGLIVSVSEYFHRILPKIPYKVFVIFFILVSFILANQGLNSVIKMSVPVLSVIYPVAITVILLILIARFIPTKRIAQQIPLIIVAIESILSLITTQGWIRISFIDGLPLKEYSLEWFPIAVVATLVGYMISYFVKQSNIVYQKE